MLVFNEDSRKVNGLAVLHLPAGPCAQFKLTSLKLSKDIRVRPSHCEQSEEGVAGRQLLKLCNSS